MRATCAKWSRPSSTRAGLSGRCRPRTPTRRRGRIENIQEFLGVVDEFVDTHDEEEVVVEVPSAYQPTEPADAAGSPDGTGAPFANRGAGQSPLGFATGLPHSSASPRWLPRANLRARCSSPRHLPVRRTRDSPCAFLRGQLACGLHRMGATAHRPRHGGRGRARRHAHDRALVEGPRV